MKQIIFSIFFMITSMAHAIGIDWSGGYRIEFTDIARPTLSDPAGHKYYGLNYLYLTPHILAADGVEITTRFNFLSNQASAYQNSQLGSLVGTQGTMVQGQSQPFTQNQGKIAVDISQLYLTVNQEFGALVVGRAPFEFGLGMTYSAGNDPFDHWYDTSDTFAYKFIIGDWSFMPVFSRLHTGNFAIGQSITDQSWVLKYENNDSGSQLAVIQNNRRGTSDALSASQLPTIPNIGSSLESIRLQTTNFYFSRIWSNLELKFEAGFQSGQSGYKTAAGKTIDLAGYGLASELYMPNKDKKWDFNFRFGIATGDDATTDDYESFIFDRNYDVAMLLFNHRLGKADFLGSNAVKSTTLTTSNSADDEAISNAFYFSPTTRYAYSDRLEIRNTFTFAQLMNNSTGTDGQSKDLGFEWDLSVVYKPTENVQWINQVGVLMPGKAFTDGISGYDNQSTSGFASRAAISF